MTVLTSSLRQTQGQRLTLTPSLRQALALLQLSSTELLLHVDSELALNPLLELEDEAFDPGVVQEQPNIEVEAMPFDVPVGIQADFGRSPSALSWSETIGQIESELPGEYDGLANHLSLTDSLLQQLGCLSVSEDQKQLVAWLIGNLNDDGLFDDTFENLIAECPIHADLSLWQLALETIQSLEPCGIGAFSRTQSLVLQLHRHAQLNPDEDGLAQLASTILESYPDVLARHDFKALARCCASKEETVQKACSLIGTLNPRPTAAFAVTAHCGYIIPDILVSKTAAGWQAEINPQTVPPLRFNQTYFDMLAQAKLSVDGENEWRQKATQARTLIHSLEHRFSTLISVAQTIVRLQSSFFEHGPSALVPMTLRGVADQLQIAESTVSRATADKYLQCPQGTFELKYFFTSSLAGQDGSSVSSMAARRRIKELIANENPNKPLSDAALAELLQKEGIELARRTVAKYREMENIAPKSLRKRSV
ncbi:MAG: RNA polymerase factor sigma-54 [Duodenibacillus sp.]|nr:RNA polymerase factor sigma-54 [Duodenibacillus sp.]